MNLTAQILAVLTLGMMSAACTSRSEGNDPVSPEPEAPGTLEATVVVSGTRPDPDGYAAVITLAGQGEPLVERVESSGGTVRFANLPVGSHSLLLEDLAANCLVLGGNPRSFTISAGGTSRLEFRVACPGPGSLRVQTVTQGVDLDTDSYAVVVEASSVREDRIGTNDSILITEEGLPPGDVWTVRLSEVPDHCLLQHAVAPVEAVVSSDPLRLRFPGEGTVRVTFTAVCLQRSSMIVFDDRDSNGLGGDILRLTFEGGPRVVNLTNHPASDWNPALSPDRSQIVFSSDRDDPNFELYSMSANGSDLMRLTHSPGYDWIGPQAWSPDGSQIVFTSTRDVPSGEIYIMNADGSGVVRLTDDGVSAGCSPAWSPDGSWIAFCRNGGIYRTTAAPGSLMIRVVSEGYDPSWSPDGSRIAYGTGFIWDFPLADLAVIGVDGTGLVQLHPDQLNNDHFLSPSWSPDGSWIALRKGAAGAPHELMVVRFEGDGFGELIKLADGSSPSWN